MIFVKEIDKYFYEKSKKDLITAGLMIVVAVGFLIYYFLYPNIDKFARKEIKKGKNLQTKIEQLQTKYNILAMQLQIMNKRIKSLELEKSSLKKQKEFYAELSNLLDFAEFNQNKWGDFIKNLVTDAKKEGLLVKELKNTLYDNNESFINKKMEVNLKLKGEYKNLIYFIYQYENTKTLLRISSLKFGSDKNYDINISLYGYSR